MFTNTYPTYTVHVDYQAPWIVVVANFDKVQTVHLEGEDAAAFIRAYLDAPETFAYENDEEGEKAYDAFLAEYDCRPYE